MTKILELLRITFTPLANHFCNKLIRKLIDIKNYTQVDSIKYELDQPNGIYLIEVSIEKDQRSLIRLIKQ